LRLLDGILILRLSLLKSNRLTQGISYRFMKSYYHIFAFLTGFAFLFLSACSDNQPEEAVVSVESYDATVFQEWNRVFLEVERYAKGYRPGPSARALGYLGLSAYECVVPGMPNHNSMESVYSGLELPQLPTGVVIHWPAAVNASYALLMERFFFHMESDFPEQYGKIGQVFNQLHERYADEVSTEVLTASEQWGRDVAAAIYNWEVRDAKGHNAFLNPQPTDYVPPTGPGYWYHLGGARAVFPYWGSVRTFAISESDKLGRKPIPYSENPNSLFYDQAEEVFKIVNFSRENTSDPQAFEFRWIAEFWSDDLLNLTFSPPIRMLAVAVQTGEETPYNLAEAAELYAKLGMALHDAGVAVWYSKYYYNTERPDTYIRRVLKNQYPEAATWKTNLNNPLTGAQSLTPAFPAYPSGHSGFAGAGGVILSSFLEFTPKHPGTYAIVDRCHADRTEFISTPRSFASISELAEEKAYSRIPLGVHFRMDCDEGLRLGELAAQRVLELPWRK
jgi:hypothetical protein